MDNVLKGWLQERLGVIMDLVPETFGRYTKDGTLLAQILHTYDVISRNQLSTIVRTYDPALSRVNLKTLRIWLKPINVALSDNSIEEISKGKGAASLRLFYEVYLSLEGKDRLPFIVLQKEKRISIAKRFHVTSVCEDQIPCQPPEHPLSQPLIEATDTILWHRDKFWKIVEACRRERKRFEAVDEYPVVMPVEHFDRPILPDRRKEESEGLDEFTRKHPPGETRKSYRVSKCCPDKTFVEVSSVEDPAAAAEYVDLLRKRNERTIKSHELTLKTQTAMLTDSWKTLLSKQDRSFDEAVGRRVLDQSRYERQIMTKLCEVRNVRNRVAENRRIVQGILLKCRESEQRLDEERGREVAAEELEDVQMEARRMCELRRRLREEKTLRLRRKYREICTEALRDLADVAVNAAEYRQANDNYIPSSVRSEWRTLFLTSQPIYEMPIVPTAGEGEEEEEEIEDRMSDERKGIQIEGGMEEEGRKKTLLVELERQKALSDGDFENYQGLASPWDEFAPVRDEDTEQAASLGRVALGYVVHRLLEFLYPYPSEVASCPVSRVKVAAVILGVTNQIVHEQLRDLLKKKGICLLRMEDAINHCLEDYKREMADVEYIDLNIIATTARDVKKFEVKGKTEDSKNGGPSKKAERRRTATLAYSGADEKQTQTPRQIPYDDMDPILSDTAYIGKWTYEFLTLGQPISNELNTKILVEYLKGIGDVDGWALINYPNTYEQMAMLEKALTGREMPPDPKIISLADVNIEDIDPISPGIVFEGDEGDAFATRRQSRLLPNPISRAKDYHRSSTTFMTMYIKVMPKSKAPEGLAEQPLSDDATSMDDYYADQNIAYAFYYDVLELPTLKELARFITGERSSGRTSSLELLETLNGKEECPNGTGSVITRRLITRSKWESSKREEKKDIETKDQQAKAEAQPASHRVRPGEDDWQWTDLPQSPILLEALATLWEYIEENYIENLKEMLCLKRIHTSAVVPYKYFVSRNLTKFIDRPDKRQDLLHEFHCTFNGIDEDLRGDLDMKCELHCRVADFRAELWELCDARRHEAEKERKRVLQDQWTLTEAVVLINVYVGILQTELDRFIDTMQLLRDYYTSMLQKQLQESRFAKVVLNYVELENVREDTKQATNDSSIRRNDENVTMQTKTKSVVASARGVNVDRLGNEIEDLLTEAWKSFNPEESNVYVAIIDSIRQARSVVDAVASTTMELLKKEEKVATTKTEVQSRNTGNASPDWAFVKLAKRNRDIVEEWRYAALFEIDRVSLRLDVLNAAARSDVVFLLDTTRRLFHNVHRYINERYKREIESVNDLANLFCFAIEEAKPIQQELLLDGDRFVVRPSVLMFPDDPKRSVGPIKEAPSPLQFRMLQLARLTDIFRRVAPCGIINERALIYILQDLVSCGEEECYPPFVPCAWRQLRSPDIARLTEQLFGATEHIEWREFILYAMDLAMPSHRDILRARAAFRDRDPELREVITRDQYHLTPLWFLECVGTAIDREHVPREDLRQDYEVILDEEADDFNHDRTVDAVLREGARFSKRAIADSTLGSDFIEMRENNSRVVLRLMLAKELLCQMYLTNGHTVNYTAMLLACCKDEDPREGLGKAFTLAMGARVCTDIAEGERYVKELLEKKRHVREMKLRRDYLQEEAKKMAEEVIDYILNRLAKGVSILERKRDHDLPPKRRVTIQILDGTGEIDPTDLLPKEITFEHLTMEDPLLDSSDREYEQSSNSATSSMPENQGQSEEDETVIFWLPRAVCLAVLSTCLPRYASEPDLFQTSRSLHEGIASAYNELTDEELNDGEDAVLAYRLVNHTFIYELISSSSKFVSRDMGALLRNILKDKDDKS